MIMDNLQGDLIQKIVAKVDDLAQHEFPVWMSGSAYQAVVELWVAEFFEPKITTHDHVLYAVEKLITEETDLEPGEQPYVDLLADLIRSMDEIDD